MKVSDFKEESTGAKVSRETLAALRNLGNKKISPWLAITAVVFPMMVSTIGIVWAASKISGDIERLRADYSQLSLQIATLQGLQGAQTTVIVKIESDLEHLQKDVGDLEMLLADQVNKMGYRIANDKEFRARFAMMGYAIPQQPTKKGQEE